MKRFEVIIIFFLFCVACKKVNNDCNLLKYPDAPEKEWFTSYSGSEEESHGHFILDCSDGGFIQVGETGIVGTSSKILVIKIQSDGNLVWKREIQTGNHNLGNAAIEVSDGYIICGSRNKNSTLIKLAKNTGEILFESIFDNGGSDAIEHVAVSPNGYIAIGYKHAADDLNTFYTEGEGCITFLTENGEKINSITTTLSHPYRIKEFNGNYLISGLTDGASDYGLININENGEVIWSKSFGGNNSDHCFGMDVSANGKIFLTGHTLSGTENWDTYTMMINENGVLDWESKIGNPRGFDPKYIHDEAWGVVSTNDGGCIVVAGTGDEYKRYKRRCGSDKDNSNTWHVYLLKYDQVGNLEWENTYGGEPCQDWAGEDICINSAGQAVVAVDNGQFGFLKITPY